MTITTLPVHPAGATVLLFPGQGSQWAGMAADLCDSSPVFTRRLRECATAIEHFTGWNVEDVLRQRPGSPSLDAVEVVQPALFAVHVSLAELWMTNGLAPQAVVGQSQGEIAAACVAGALTLDDAARVIALRSQLFAETLVGTGGIASIDLPGTAVEHRLRAYPGKLEIAGRIGPRTTTVAGDVAALDELVAQCNADGAKATVVPASIPSHCFAIEPLRAQLTEMLAPVRPQTARIPMYSTVTAAQIDGRRLTADYWYDNARRPVEFDPAIRRLLFDGARVFVESSAHPVLTRAITATADTLNIATTVTGTLRRGHGGAEQFQASLVGVPHGMPATVSAA